jgi:hypothetical protein
MVFCSSTRSVNNSSASGCLLFGKGAGILFTAYIMRRNQQLLFVLLLLRFAG